MKRYAIMAKNFATQTLLLLAATAIGLALTFLAIYGLFRLFIALI